MQWYTHDDTATYVNPTSLLQPSFTWKEGHGGINVTLTELKKAGISIVDSTSGANTSKHSETEKVEITDLLTDKTYDMLQGMMRDFNRTLWSDGTADPKSPPGILSMVTTTPAVGVTGGLNRATYPFWRNRAPPAVVATLATAPDQPLTETMEVTWLQQRRYQGKPTDMFAGSKFIEAYQRERRVKGTYTQTGFQGKQDSGMGDLYFKGIEIQYEPTLDELGMDKYCFSLDLKNAIQLYAMTGEDWKKHAPARPPEKYVMYKAMTWTGALTAWQLSGCAVFRIA
jgi:hypothetical protein